MSDLETKCAYCGMQRREHYSVNFADGPFVSGATLVCPSAIFKAMTPLEAKQSKRKRGLTPRTGE